MQNRRGIILFSVIIILLTITLIGASLVSFFSSLDVSVRTMADETKARYLAEAGIAYAVNILRNQAGAAGQMGETIGPVPLGDGTFTVKFDLTQSLITSLGRVAGIEKTIQLQYSSL